MREFDETDFRNYAHDILGIDTGTPSGMGRYVEWLEELICSENKLKEIKQAIRDQNEWFNRNKKLS